MHDDSHCFDSLVSCIEEIGYTNTRALGSEALEWSKVPFGPIAMAYTA